MSSPLDNPLNGEDYEALHQYLFRGTADITWRDFGRATEIENLDSIEGNFLNDSGRFRKILSILSETPRTLDELCEVLRNNERTELAEKLRNWLISTRSLHRCSGKIVQFPLTLLPCFCLQKKTIYIPFVISSNHPSHCICMIIVVGRIQRVGVGCIDMCMYYNVVNIIDSVTA